MKSFIQRMNSELNANSDILKKGSFILSQNVTKKRKFVIKQLKTIAKQA